MVAPLSGKTFSVVLLLLGIFMARLGSVFGENRIANALISVTWSLSVDMNVPLIWSDMIWAMGVFMGAFSFGGFGRVHNFFARVSPLSLLFKFIEVSISSLDGLFSLSFWYFWGVMKVEW